MTGSDEIINIVDNGYVHSVIHMCTDVFRIIGTGQAFIDDWQGDTPLEVQSNDDLIKFALEQTIKDQGGIPGIPIPILTGSLITKAEFDKLYPNAILFRIVLYGLDFNPLSNEDSNHVQNDLTQWEVFTHGFLGLRNN